MELTGAGRRRVCLSVALAVAGALAVTAALAYACTVQPTVSLTQSSATPHSAVAGTGEYFSETGGPVELHFNSLESAVVWSGQPDAVGRIAFQFEVPDVAPGTYTIVATQAALGTGQPVAGTPSRAPLTVVAANEPQAPLGAPALPIAQRDRPGTAPGAPEAAPAPSLPPAGSGSRPARADRATPIGVAPAPGKPTANRSAVRAATRTGKPGPSPTATSNVAPTASERSAAGNVWEGFDSAGSGSPAASDRTTLPASGPGSQQAVGLGILGLGLAGLLGGFLVAATRRRRKTEKAHTPRGSAR